MRKLLWVLAIMCCAAPPVLAGPNAGGSLLVHDTGLAYSTDTVGPPYGGLVPTICTDVDIEAPLGAPPIIWKVYAAFPSGSSPRLQGLAWGMDITPQGDGYITMAAGGMVNGGDFEVTQDGWPTTNGASIGQSFPVSGTKTTLMTEVYWFAGYAYGGASGSTVQYFCAKPHSVQASMFVDDAPIKNSDPIATYGCLGFGGPGHVHCPCCAQPVGACCDVVLGVCTITTQAACSYSWLGANTACSALACPVPQPDGACCDFVTGSCSITKQSACAFNWLGAGIACSPLACPLVDVFGACCDPVTGACGFTVQAMCTGNWTTGAMCAPNYCPLPAGSCCHPDGSCLMVLQADCSGPWTMFGYCDPTVCPAGLYGSCCYPDGTCSMTVPGGDCTGNWTAFGVCPPSTCQWTVGGGPYTVSGYVRDAQGNGIAGVQVTKGCDVGGWTEADASGYWIVGNISEGSCTFTPVKTGCTFSPTSRTISGSATDVNFTATCEGSPPVGVCCDMGISCAMTTQAACTTIWTVGGTCIPFPCLAFPIEKKTWGEVKNMYR